MSSLVQVDPDMYVRFISECLTYAVQDLNTKVIDGNAGLSPSEVYAAFQDWHSRHPGIREIPNLEKFTTEISKWLGVKWR